jgi:hypothetical protein
MKRSIALLTLLVLVLGLATTVTAQASKARVRVVHASPDAPAVDVLVNDGVAFSNAPFTGITQYASLDPATYNVKVVPTGETEPVVIEEDLGLEAQDYTVVAVGRLENIEPLVLVDDNTVPPSGQARVRFVHAVPDAPNVDIAVQDGPVLFENVPFKQAFPYITVDAGTYDLEVRVHDTGDVVLEVPGVSVEGQNTYTVYAMGLVEGPPALQAVVSADATGATTLPATGATNYTLLFTLGICLLGLLFLTGGVLIHQHLS